MPALNRAGDSPYFDRIDPYLSPEVQQARNQRRHHAEWGLAVARLHGTEPTPAPLLALQRYINGEVSLAELMVLDDPPGPATALYQAVAQRAQFAG